MPNDASLFFFFLSSSTLETFSPLGAWVFLLPSKTSSSSSSSSFAPRCAQSRRRRRRRLVALEDIQSSFFLDARIVSAPLAVDYHSSSSSFISITSSSSHATTTLGLRLLFFVVLLLLLLLLMMMSVCGQLKVTPLFGVQLLFFTKSIFTKFLRVDHVMVHLLGFNIRSNLEYFQTF